MNTSTQSAPATSLRPWQHAALFLATCAVIVARRPDELFHPQFFAEDGKVWFADAYNLGWLHALSHTWTGYFLTLPRLGGALAQLVPFLHAPLVLNLIAIGVQALPVSVLLSSRSAAWGSLRFRLLLAALYLALPNCAELSSGITESQWHLALAAFLLLVASPARTTTTRALDLVLLLISGLSGPFCIFLFPIAAFIAFRRTGKHRLLPAAALALCCAIQLIALTILDRTGRPHHPIGATADLFVRIIGGRIVLSTLVGNSGLPRAAGPEWLLLFISLTILGIAIVAACFLQSTLEMRLFLVFSSLVFAASLVSITTLQPAQVPVWQILLEQGGVRYWFFPTLALVWSLAASTRSRFPLLKAASILVLALTSIGILRDFRQPAFKDMHFAEQVQRFNNAPTGTTVIIPENPAGWTLSLTKH